jgi:hypothetical protein
MPLLAAYWCVDALEPLLPDHAWCEPKPIFEFGTFDVQSEFWKVSILIDLKFQYKTKNTPIIPQ